jgi:hypothetical protein
VSKQWVVRQWKEGCVWELRAQAFLNLGKKIDKREKMVV